MGQDDDGNTFSNATPRIRDSIFQVGDIAVRQNKPAEFAKLQTRCLYGNPANLMEWRGINNSGHFEPLLAYNA